MRPALVTHRCGAEAVIRAVHIHTSMYKIIHICSEVFMGLPVFSPTWTYLLLPARRHLAGSHSITRTRICMHKYEFKYSAMQWSETFRKGEGAGDAACHRLCVMFACIHTYIACSLRVKVHILTYLWIYVNHTSICNIKNCKYIYCIYKYKRAYVLICTIRIYGSMNFKDVHLTQLYDLWASNSNNNCT